MLFWPSEEGFWPLTAFITSEVKNNYDHVTMEGILNKISEKKFCRMHGFTMSSSTTIKNIDKIFTMTT